MALSRSGLTRQDRLGITFNVVLICLLGALLAIGLVLFVQRMAYTSDLRWDLTQEQVYALDPEAQTLLGEVQTKVEVYAIYGIDQNVEARVKDLFGQTDAQLIEEHYLPLLARVWERVDLVLREWARTSPHVSLERVLANTRRGDPRRYQEVRGELGLAKQELMNTIVLRHAGRIRQVPLNALVDVDWGFFPPDRRQAFRAPRILGRWRLQAELTAALRGLVRGERVKIGVAAGLGSVVEAGTPEFDALRNAVSSEGYELTPLRLTEEGRVPEDLAAVVVAGPSAELDEAWVNCLRRYETTGGRLLLMADPRRPETFSALLEPFGVQMLDGAVEDPRNGHRVQQGGVVRLTLDLNSPGMATRQHPITSPLFQKVPLWLGWSRALRTGPDFAPGAERIPLLLGSVEAALRPLRFDQREQRWDLRSERQPLEEAPRLGYALKRPHGGQGAAVESRVVLLGSSGVLTPQALRTYGFGNRDLLSNTLSWLVSRPVPRSRMDLDKPRSRLASVNEAEGPFFLFGVVLLPFAALMTGVIVALVRRSR